MNSRYTDERTYRGLVRNLKAKNPLGRPRRRCEIDSKINFKVEWRTLDSSGSRKGQMAGLCDHGNELYVA